MAELVWNDFAAGAQLVDGAAEIDGVPEDDGGDGEIEAGGAVALVFEGPIADFAETVEEHGTGEGVACFALVETSVGPPAQGGSLIQSSVNNVRSRRPISRSALARAFCRG